MDDLQNFVAAMNLSKFRDQIRTEVDPARRKTLHHADAEHRRLPPMWLSRRAWTASLDG